MEFNSTFKRVKSTDRQNVAVRDVKILSFIYSCKLVRSERCIAINVMVETCKKNAIERKVWV